MDNELIFDIEKILSMLPHRYPFILVDRIVELVPNERVTALKNVTINEPFFQGHFPGKPIMPGVLILEAMAQAGGVLAIISKELDMEASVVYLSGMDKVKFRKPVVPGDQLIFNIELLKARSKTFKMAGVATVDGNRVAEAEVLAVFGEK